MIEASISAVPGLVISFLVLGALLVLLTVSVARVWNKPWRLPAALALSIAGILSVTLLPGNGGLEAAQCDAGAPLHLFTSTSSLLNIALFAPGAFLGVLALRRPMTVAAAFVCLSGTVELLQATTHVGRSCSLSDVVANATGSVLGACLGALWCSMRRTPALRPGRDVLWGASLLVLGCALFATLLHTRIDTVDIVAKDDARQQRTDTAVQANEWLGKAATATFGKGTEITGSSVEEVGKRLKVTAETDRGGITGWWPERRLESAWSKNDRGAHGNSGPEAAAAVAERFARIWFPHEVVGGKRRVRTLGEGSGRVYLVTYSRYEDGVRIPVRLDITVTTDRRITGFHAGPWPSP
ncbi:hypothetical protein DV517_30740 [Streptomyces sp. S816]|uniref:VanZ family protein n=1 Tax=Streptomyces sp. S816 TaxID=2283197 RepID=UPI00109CC102|nr:VanZ family protein [Streptomyces sp. S816]TGZ18101.1 hypothetical protein DV517_30740 [Streptomyces sp. S816]